ncbi:MAG: DUF1501 domain-containing protein [Isosphaeraceae bacterium]|nr:DUF1501 domain-containing protein [Isosphaeraceae bacterium]
MASSHCGRFARPRSRREFLEHSAHGFGMAALGALLSREARASALAVVPPTGAVTHRHARATSVIFLYMTGGPSQLDTFDPKPELTRLDGQPIPDSFKTEGLQLQFMKAGDGRLMASPFRFDRHGRSGLEISDLFPQLALHADDLAVIRSLHHDSFIHGPAINYLCTGSSRVGHPSVGSWISYGLGSESDELPTYLVMNDGQFRGGSGMYGSGYLPALHQGTLLRTEGTPIQNLSSGDASGTRMRRLMLDRLETWNRRHAAERPEDDRLEARIANHELAFRMQTSAPELIALDRESAAVRELYGVDVELTNRFARMCLLARRMIERGVRFVQLINNDWDGHADCAENHRSNARRIDRPIAALLQDLKSRGLLDSTLVVWCGEFGRTPVMQGNRGRDHSPYGFSVWMAGGGIRGGKVIGATDALGFRAVEDPIHVNDLHATILALLGLDHEKLTYLSEGRNRRLTDVGGQREFSGRLVSGG